MTGNWSLGTGNYDRRLEWYLTASQTSEVFLCGAESFSVRSRHRWWREPVRRLRLEQPVRPRPTRLLERDGSSRASPEESSLGTPASRIVAATPQSSASKGST